MKNETKQTAVEWLLFELSKNGLLPDGIPSDIHNKAKAMHKEEIINSFFEGAYGGDNISGEQYYNETYGDESNP